jgi:hypothetical protein
MKQPASFRAISRKLSDAYGEERLLFKLGLLGIGLGAIGLVLMAARGRTIAPEGDLYRAASFSIAIGIYILTLILFIPFAGFSSRGLRWWRWWTIALGLYAYSVENIQIYRGLNPRFTRVGSVADNVLGTLFGFVALGLIVMFLFLTWRFFRNRNEVKNRLLLLAIRYGCVATIFGFVAGVLMGANQGSQVGTAGSMLPFHAAGFHGLQAVPLVALLLSWAHMPLEAARRWVHAAGLAWLGLMAAIAWQTMRGHSILEPSLLMLLAGSLMFIWLLCAARAVISCGHANSHRYTARSRAAA